MYNVGFGDAFLVLIPTSEGTRKILFDCGSIVSAGTSIEDVVKRIIEDAKEPDGTSRIHVVVGTHRHRDHVSGFASPLWANVQVGEVWMPWTEDPKDPTARSIRNKQNRLASHLQRAFEEKLAGAVSAQEREKTAMFQTMALNALANAEAMQTLHEGFAGKPKRRFLPTKAAEDQTFETNILPGVTTHVMGPSRDERVIRDMNPPAGQSYLSLAEAGSREEPRIPEPFPEEWWLEIGDPLLSDQLLPKRDRAVIKNATGGMEEALALALDQAINGTSLMLLLQIGTVSLLFPGDAQWGTWRVALANPDWRTLIGRTTFYKIGHHGSHNATPKDLVENVFGNDSWAMVSTRHIAQWPNIPRKPLLDALSQRTTRLARSDELGKAPKMFTVKEPLVAEARIPL